MWQNMFCAQTECPVTVLSKINASDTIPSTFLHLLWCQLPISMCLVVPYNVCDCFSWCVALCGVSVWTGYVWLRISVFSDRSSLLDKFTKFPLFITDYLLWNYSDEILVS
jgi:hypothetical protein